MLLLLSVPELRWLYLETSRFYTIDSSLRLVLRMSRVVYAKTSRVNSWIESRFSGVYSVWHFSRFYRVHDRLNSSYFTNLVFSILFQKFATFLHAAVLRRVIPQLS